MEDRTKPLSEEEKALIISWFIEKEGKSGEDQIKTLRLKDKLDKSPKVCRELIDTNIKSNQYKIDSLSFYMLLMAHI